MQGIRSAAGAKDYVFVDGIRFWAMVSIIAVHSLNVFIAVKKPDLQLLYLLATPVKFGTIAFFLISGFLLGDRLDTCRPMSYLGRRLKTVFVPWLCWFSLMVAYKTAHHRVELVSGVASWSLLGPQIFQTLFLTPYWFVPNLMLGLGLLLLFRRHVFDLRLGAAFLAIDLFYTVNIYGRWIPSGHTEALLGFVFFLWFGSYVSGRIDEVRAWLARIPMYWMVCFTVAAACCAYGEARWVVHLGDGDPVNTLRFTNQIFSVMVVLTLVKVRRATWPKFVNARRVTFGLYLSHPLALEVGFRLARFATHGFASGLLATRAGLICLWLATFAVVYGLGLAVTQLLAGWSATQWLVGVTPAKKPAVAVELPATGAGALMPVVGGSGG